MGTYFTSIDLIDLTRNNSKDKHLLTLTDFKPEDKMNFASLEKICSTKVIGILTQVPGTNATVAYLSIMNNILSTYLDRKLNLEERIYKMWYSF